MTPANDAYHENVHLEIRAQGAEYYAWTDNSSALITSIIWRRRA